MDNDEKLDFVYRGMIEFKRDCKTLFESRNKHESAIYGNGKDGLLTRASLLEDEVSGFKSVQKKINIMWWALGLMTSGTVLGLFIMGIRKI